MIKKYDFLTKVNKDIQLARKINLKISFIIAYHKHCVPTFLWLNVVLIVYNGKYQNGILYIISAIRCELRTKNTTNIKNYINVEKPIWEKILVTWVKSVHNYVLKKQHN